MQTWRLRANLAEARGWRKPARNLPKPGEAGRNPAEPGGTWRKPGGTRRKKSKLKGGVVGSITFGMAYTPNPPPSTYFFSAKFPPGSAGFRRVPPGSAGFRRVPPGSAGFRWVSPGSAGFRWVPPLRWVLLGSAGFQAFARSVPPACAGFCRFRQQGSCYRLPLQFIARIDTGSCQASVKVAAIKEAFFCKCPDSVQVGLWKKSPIRWLSWWSSRSCLLWPHEEGDAILIFDFHCSAFPHWNVPTCTKFHWLLRWTHLPLKMTVNLAWPELVRAPCRASCRHICP